MSSLNTRDSYENLKLGKLGGGNQGQPGNWDRTQVEHRQLRRELKNRAIFQPLSVVFMVIFTFPLVEFDFSPYVQPAAR